jgi:hypothetical protein
MMRKYHVRFGGGPVEKGRKRYLASGLPNIAAEIGAKHFPDRFEQPDPFTWVEHYAYPEERDPTLREMWSRVRFDSYTPRLVTLGGVVRTKLGIPRWIHMPTPNVARLIGQREVADNGEGRR